MKTPFLFLLTAVAVHAGEPAPLPTAEPAEVGMSAETLAEIGPAVERSIKDGELAGASVLVLRKGRVVYQEQFGHRDVDAGKPVEKDTIFRIYSMTKAITSAAALMLVEEEKLALDDPIHAHLPEFEDVTVWVEDGEPVAPGRAPTVRDLLRHTAGFCYGWGAHPVDAMYRENDVLGRDRTLAEMTAAVAEIPLRYQPGERWMYGINTDVLARVVEVASGDTFDRFLQKRVFKPLGMPDTSFFVPTEKVDRFSAVYSGASGELNEVESIEDSRFLEEPAFLSGGGGLVSTVNDYGRFLQMIANGGTFQGERHLSQESVRLMTRDQLPDDIPAISFGDEVRHGVGFGLGFSVRHAIDDRWDSAAPTGEYGWGGLASTHYWVSPEDELVVVTMEQTIPYNWNLESALKPIIYRAVFPE